MSRGYERSSGYPRGRRIGIRGHGMASGTGFRPASGQIHDRTRG
jgi:hypothetical protein